MSLLLEICLVSFPTPAKKLFLQSHLWLLSLLESIWSSTVGAQMQKKSMLKTMGLSLYCCGFFSSIDLILFLCLCVGFRRAAGLLHSLWCFVPTISVFHTLYFFFSFLRDLIFVPYDTTQISEKNCMNRFTGHTDFNFIFISCRTLIYAIASWHNETSSFSGMWNTYCDISQLYGTFVPSYFKCWCSTLCVLSGVVSAFLGSLLQHAHGLWISPQ